MPRDPARMEDTRAWLTKAKLDLEAGEFEKAKPSLLGDVAFHAQQAAEKALKALLAWHDIPFPKTHDIERLGRICVQTVPSLQSAVDRAVPLTEYAWKFRYPGEVEQPTRDEVEEALTAARAVYRRVLEELPEEVRP